MVLKLCGFVLGVKDLTQRRGDAGTQREKGNGALNVGMEGFVNCDLSIVICHWEAEVGEPG